MTKEERMKEIAKASPDFGKMTGYKMCVVDELYDIKELQKENAELKEELKKWKDEWQEQVQKENDESYARTLQTIQLNKAKKIISNLYAICKDNHYPNTSVLMEQAEQFLKECE